MKRIWLALLLSSAATLPAAAQTRTGAAAYGDWRSDAPGVMRLLRPADLPPPYATTSASDAASIARRPAGLLPKAPPGFDVSLFAAGLEEPRSMRVAPNGDVFLSESGAGRVRVFHTEADGSVQSGVFAADLHRPFGIGFFPPGPQPAWVYVAEPGRVVRFPYQSGDRRARGAAQTIVGELPTGGHWTRDLAFTPDGQSMLVSVGSSSNLGSFMDQPPPGGIVAWDQREALGASWGADSGRADVLRFTPDGKNESILATGIRNCVSMAWQPGTANLWCAVNERDGLGNNLPPDYATHVQTGAFYGWPWYYIGDHEEPRLAGARPDLANRVTVPDVLIQPHSAPLGIVFYDGGGFPADYRGDAFVALHGSWNRAPRTGYKVVRLRMRDGRPTGAYEDFLTGFIDPSTGRIWGRPVGVAVTQDGSLLVSEDGGGTVWRVRATH